MYWLRWHYSVEDIAGAPYKIKQNKNKQKRQKRRQSVVAGRQQLCSAVQSQILSKQEFRTAKKLARL